MVYQMFGILRISAKYRKCGELVCPVERVAKPECGELVCPVERVAKPECGELVCPVERVAKPEEHVVINDQRGHLAWLMCNQAHPGFELPDLAGPDFFLGTLHRRQDNVAEHRDPVHAFGRKILHSAVECIVSVRSRR